MNQLKPLTFDAFKKKLLKEGYLIPKFQENEYLKENNLYLKRFSNGAKLIASQKKEPDSRHSSVNFNFSTGSYFDPKGKRGAHHFLEHLFISSALSVFLNKHYIDHNAYTSQTRVVVYNSGVYNTSFPDIGLLKGLSWTIENIIDPFGLKNSDMFEYERNVILKEITERSGDYKTLTYDTFYEAILEEENPYALSAIGTEKSVKAVTEEDMRHILANRIGTNNLIVSILASGKGNEAEKLMEFVDTHIDRFPRKAKRTEIDLNMYSKIKMRNNSHPVRVKLPITNKITAIFLVWMIEAEGFSEDVVGFNFLVPHIRNILFNAARDRGLGYTIDFFNTHFLPNTMMVGGYLLVPSTDEEKSIEEFELLIKKILSDVKANDAEITELLQIEKDSQKVTPISQKAKLNQCLSTLSDFDLLTDSRVARQIYLNVTEELLKKLITSIENTPPLTVIVGDLHEK